METVHKYTSSNRLLLYAQKTKIMLLTTKTKEKENFQIILNGKLIRHSSKLKILGNIVTDNLSWDSQVEKIVKQRKQLTDYSRYLSGSGWGSQKILIKIIIIKIK